MLDLVYPLACAVCSAPLRKREERRLALCEACWRRLSVVGDDVCVRCGMPQGPHVGRVTRCAGCPSEFGGVEETVALGRYEAADSAAPLRTAILALKYRQVVEAARMLGGLLAGEVVTRPWVDEVDWVVPVPLHWRRQMERRYNQADLIARELARRLKRLRQPLLVRTRYTESQTALPRLARASNVDGAFALVPRWRRWLLGCGPLHGRALLLVDDVLTTGATLRNCARVLKQAGVARVFAAVAARA